jgi:hypothetical protein
VCGPSPCMTVAMSSMKLPRTHLVRLCLHFTREVVVTVCSQLGLQPDTLAYSGLSCSESESISGG